MPRAYTVGAGRAGQNPSAFEEDTLLAAG